MLLTEYGVVDLTHPIAAGMPVWPGDPAVVVERLAEQKQDGYNLNRLCIGEHTGTHVGAPRHFVDAGKTIDELPVAQLFLPAVKLVHDGRPNSLISLDEIRNWESLHGKMASGLAVLLQTGWDCFWPDATAYLCRDENGGMHFPGLSLEAARYLIDDRGVRVLGIDTAGVDGGASLDFAVDLLLAQRGGIHVENLTHLTRLPEKDFYLFLGALPITGGTGSPARVMALVPR